MIDTLKESDKPGDRFYTRADINGRQPSLKIIGKSACKNTVDIACTEPQFSTFCSLIGKSNLSKMLDLPDAKNTVYAPTNDKVTVDLSDGGVKINNSTVIGPDVLASNGIIHVIDQVLVPSSIDVTAFLETCSDDETTDEVEV